MMQRDNWQWWLAIYETVAKPVTRSIVFPCFEILLEKNFWAVFISKRQSSLSNKFYDRNQTLQLLALIDLTG